MTYIAILYIKMEDNLLIGMILFRIIIYIMNLCE